VLYFSWWPCRIARLSRWAGFRGPCVSFLIVGAFWPGPLGVRVFSRVLAAMIWVGPGPAGDDA
jgi:hypothetical protein